MKGCSLSTPHHCCTTAVKVPFCLLKRKISSLIRLLRPCTGRMGQGASDVFAAEEEDVDDTVCGYAWCSTLSFTGVAAALVPLTLSLQIVYTVPELAFAFQLPSELWCVNSAAVAALTSPPQSSLSMWSLQLTSFALYYTVSSCFGMAG